MQPANHSLELPAPTASNFGTLSELFLLDYKALFMPFVSWEQELLPWPVPSSQLFSKMAFRPESATLEITPVTGDQGNAQTVSLVFETLNNKVATQQALDAWQGKRIFALCRPAGDGIVWGLAPLVLTYSFKQGDSYVRAPRFAVTLQPKGPVAKIWSSDEWQNPNLNRHAFSEGFNLGFS